MEMFDVCVMRYQRTKSCTALTKSNQILTEADLHLEKAEEICKIGIGSKASVGKIAMEKIEQKKMFKIMAQMGNVSI